MKLTAVGLLKNNGDSEPTLFGLEADLSSFGYFQRGTVKELLTFVSRTVAKRTVKGQRQTVQHEEYFCNVQNRDGLVGVAFVDKDYPTRAAFSIVAKVLDDFIDQSADRWRSATQDSDEASQLLKAALTRYQVCALAKKNLKRIVGGVWSGGKLVPML